MLRFCFCFLLRIVSTQRGTIERIAHNKKQCKLLGLQLCTVAPVEGSLASGSAGDTRGCPVTTMWTETYRDGPRRAETDRLTEGPNPTFCQEARQIRFVPAEGPKQLNERFL